jgi:uncharacterized membrane protein
MALAVLAWLVAIPMLGVVTGLRSMMPMAVLCWFAFAKQLDVGGTWAAWTAKLSMAIIFTILALAELIADKLPWTPNRTSPAPLAARLFLGGLIGAIAAIGLDGSSTEGGFLALVGALLGAFLGYHARRDIVQRYQLPDWRVAAAEDVIAIGCAVVAMGIITG